MARRGRRGALLIVALSVAAASLVATRAFYACQLFVPHAVIASPSVHSRGQRRVIARQAEEAGATRSAALVKVEEDIEAKIAEANEAHDDKRVTELARLLVLAKASEGAAAWQATVELRDAVGDSMAATLADFVGKEDYDIGDVASVIDERVSSAVSKMENVYLTAEAAADAPPGSNPVVLSDVMAPVVDEMGVAAKESVLAFTGKDKYEFGDISMEADRRAKAAVANLLGKEEYKFGDISKAAASKTMDALTSFTGKKDYQFGDVTKTLLKGALNWMEGDGDKKKE